MAAPKKTAATDDTEIVESTTPEPETYTSSPHPTSLFSALSKAQGEFWVVVKDRSNPAFKGGRYATLDSVNKAIREPLAKYHLAVTSFFKRTEDGGYSFTTRVTFGDTGEFTEIDYPITLPANIQQQGSLITYVRRYSICALLNLVAEEDDDGNAASGKTQPNYAEVEPLPFSKTKCLEWAKTNAPNCHASDEERSLKFDFFSMKGYYDTDSKWKMLCWENRDRYPLKSATDVAE